MLLIMVSVLVERNPEEKSNNKLQVGSACVCRSFVNCLIREMSP